MLTKPHLRNQQRAAIYQLKADDQAAAFGVVAAKAPGREDLNPRIRPRAQNALLKSLGNSMVVAMADGNVAAREPTLPHAVDQRADGALRTARLTLDDDPALVAGAADSPTCPAPWQESPPSCAYGRF